GWTSAPNSRGTIDILWTCLFTVFLCCWTAIHPGIPHPKSLWWQRYLDRTICLLVGAIAPEIFIYIAFFERMDVMVIHQEPPPNVSYKKWTTVHRFYFLMGGYCIGWHPPEEAEIARVGYLRIGVLYELLRDGRIDPKNLITKEDILDKGKADGLVKTVTLLQIVWVLVQSIARCIQHLPLTTLEISTLAYIPCAAIVFGLWWNKPYDVSVPTIIDMATYASPHYRAVETEQYTIIPATYQTYGMARQFRDAVVSSLVPIGFGGWVSVVVFFLVGSIHLAAWNFSFPSPFEKWAWRACSLVLTISIPFSWVLTRGVLRLVRLVLDMGEAKAIWLAGTIQGIGVGLYVIARLYLLVEVFVSLRAVPKDAYDTPDWTRFLPHV
ncbi:uncharacterized protein BDR25DRAFT_151913, partial [Lindgomyces ingoldianus]